MFEEFRHLPLCCNTKSNSDGVFTVGPFHTILPQRCEISFITAAYIMSIFMWLSSCIPCKSWFSVRNSTPRRKHMVPVHKRPVTRETGDDSGSESVGNQWLYCRICSCHHCYILMTYCVIVFWYQRICWCNRNFRTVHCKVQENKFDVIFTVHRR